MTLPGGMVAPDYGGACLANLVPALQAPAGSRPSWVRGPLIYAEQVVLLVLDGLGWLQLQERPAVAPVLSGLAGGPLTSVAPSTTATALTSLTLGLPPAVHGIVGYKFLVEGPSGREVLNALRWTTSSGDARPFFPPLHAQPQRAFGDAAVPVVSRADFAGTGFSQAHQQGARDVGWSVASSMPVLVARLLAEGHGLIYVYYDGVDKVAHASGFGELYDAELAYVDSLVSRLLSVLPPRAALAVTADHGQVQVGHRAKALAPELWDLVSLASGEARFRWLHAREGHLSELLAAVRQLYGAEAWVASREEVVTAGLFGGSPAADVRARLGDVVIVPTGADAYLDPRDGGDARLVCRHGGLTAEEMLVPLLAGNRRD